MRNHVIFMTDGRPNRDKKHHESDAKQLSDTYNVAITTVGMGLSAERLAALEQIALPKSNPSLPGHEGRGYRVDSASELSRIYQQIAVDLTDCDDHSHGKNTVQKEGSRLSHIRC